VLSSYCRGGGGARSNHSGGVLGSTGARVQGIDADLYEVTVNMRPSIYLRRLSGWISAVALLMLANFLPAEPNAEARDAVSPDALATIRAANEDWLPAFRRRDAAALAAPYASDGLFVTTGGQVLRGREAVEQMYARRLATITRVLGGKLVQDGTARVSETLVYEWGHGTLTVEKSDGTQSTGGGPYLTVWHRNNDGKWQITRNLVL
jgi:uncharacterized protein (TIGR02246 family)